MIPGQASSVSRTKEIWIANKWTSSRYGSQKGCPQNSHQRKAVKCKDCKNCNIHQLIQQIPVVGHRRARKENEVSWTGCRPPQSQICGKNTTGKNSWCQRDARRNRGKSTLINWIQQQLSFQGPTCSQWRWDPAGTKRTQRPLRLLQPENPWTSSGG